MKTKLDWALEHARAGWLVFPLLDNGKKPRPEMTKWPYRATADETQIRQWWARWPNANVAGTTAARIVMDVDVRRNGHDMLRKWDALHGITKTLTHRTASGGHHIVYHAPADSFFRNKDDGLGLGIDIKASGGYLVMPGSTIDGKAYTACNTLPIVAAPQWVLDECKKGTPKDKNAGDRLIAADDVAESLAQAWLRDHTQDVIEGGRDSKGFEVACKLYDFGVDDATALMLLTDWNEVRCHPPLSESEIAKLARSGRDNRQTPIGILHPGANAFEAVLIEDKPEKEEPPKPSKFLTTPASVLAGNALKIVGMPLIKGVLDRGTTAAVYGPSGSGKTFCVLDLAYHVHGGRDWNGRQVHQGSVFYLASEGGHGINKRLLAKQQQYGPFDPTRFHVLAARVDLLRGNDAREIYQEILRLEALHGHKIEMFVVDTLSRVMPGGDENGPQDMTRVVATLDGLRDVAKTNVTLVHHTGKDVSKGLRGHSSLLAAVDTEIKIEKGVFAVKKQRDMDGEWSMRFSLQKVRVGMDPEGQEVSSCIVAFDPKVHEGFEDVELQLPKELADLAAKIKGALGENKTFDIYFAIKAAGNLPRKGFEQQARTVQGQRHYVLRELSKLFEHGVIEKVKPGQWLMK